MACFEEHQSRCAATESITLGKWFGGGYVPKHKPRCLLVPCAVPHTKILTALLLPPCPW